jgi:hypothetical protein
MSSLSDGPRKTGPSSLPEEAVWPGEAGAEGTAAPSAPAADGPEAARGPQLKALVREEIVGMEREIEKRVRARVLADLKEWMSGENKGPGPKE